MEENSIRYKFAPQMKEYHKIGKNIFPYIMFTNRVNKRSDIVNTDINGFRFNSYKNGFRTIYDQVDSKKFNFCALMGGSSAFGVGATKDDKTISSLLSDNYNFFYNFGIKAGVHNQDIITYNSFINSFKNFGKIVIFSGINDLYKYVTSPNFVNENFGNVFHESKILNLNLGWKRKFAKFFLKPFTNIDLDHISKKDFIDHFFKNKKVVSKINLTDRFNSFKIIMEKYFNFLNIVQKGTDSKITYVLQPLIYWCKTNYSHEEEMIINDRNRDKNNLSLKKLFTQKIENIYLYDEYKKFLENTCKKFSINFIDSNELFYKKYNKKKNFIFVDSVHLTDLGYKFISECIKEKL